MADFARWATACEGALWPAGTFLVAYDGNRDQAVIDVIEADAVATAVQAFARRQGTEWKGTATELLSDLAEEPGATSKTWPNNARSLSGRLRRASPHLRKIGIQILFIKEGRGRTRKIHITSCPVSENAGVGPSAPSAPPAQQAKPNFVNGLPDALPQTVGSHADGCADHSRPQGEQTARVNPLKDNRAGCADGADAICPARPVSEKARPAGWRERR